MSNNQPWHRRQDETSKAYNAFVVYRDMGKSRTTRKVAQELSKSDTLIFRWCRKHNWVSRCNAFDAWRSQQLEKAALEHDKEQYLKDLEQYRQETLKLGRAITSNSAQLLKIVQQHLQDIENLKPRDIAVLSRAAAIAAETGSKLSAEALAVEELMSRLKLD